ncbi:hypothetical protein ADIARSV_3328 [Arcticibacter svalbardensis MN12-7]|uniref:Uncharacterized protein n=1 Tax=Arcticibacter svalbardensis MN12-7 TaxID=1150600 RepID=R9GP63_9SPHI|nr:hypothetical protein ADIARSV_3328 [Arcticibacter svalbardensis MN12-7]
MVKHFGKEKIHLYILGMFVEGSLSFEETFQDDGQTDMLRNWLHQGVNGCSSA